jgi:hypothetical protein
MSSVSAGIAGTLLTVLLSAPPAAHAAQVNDGCMEDIYDEFGQGGGLGCNANDVTVTNVTNLSIIDDGCAFASDTITIDATFEVTVTSQERYDIGIYLSTDGGDALNGSCLIVTLPYQPNNEACTAAGTPFACCTGRGLGTCAFIDGDGTSNSLPGPSGTGACSGDDTMPCNEHQDCIDAGAGTTCVAIAANTMQDVCGDIFDNMDLRNPISHDVTGVTATCTDTNGDGLLEVNGCTTWRQSGAQNELCLSPLYAFPGAPSKCNCDLTLTFPILASKTIKVCKELVPGDDSGRFNLQIDGTTELADASDGDCTDAVSVPDGLHSVGETAGTGTILTAYDTGISCQDLVGRCTADDTIHCVTDTVCDQANPGDTCDPTPTAVASCTDCTALDFNVPDMTSDIVCTITNTNACSGTGHFKCYRTVQVGDRFEPRTVHLADQFGATETEVRKPERFCNPADKNAEGIDDPTAHLMCYKVKEPSRVPVNVVVENQFGAQRLTVGGADTLCTPAEKDGVPSPLSLNHFKCYKAKPTKGSPKWVEQLVDVADQFEDKVTRVMKPSLLCNPVDKNGEGIPCEGNHLLCYRIKDAAGQMPFQRRTVDVLDQFGLPEVKVLRGDCRSTAYFCVPSTKRIASPSGAFVDIARGLLD